MAIPKNKEELILVINKEFDKLYFELNSKFVKENFFNKELDGHKKGDIISIHNLISYLIGWNNLVLKWNLIEKEELKNSLPEENYNWNQLGELAQKFYKDYEKYSYENLLRLFSEIKEEILNIISNFDSQELYEDNWYKKYSFGRMIQLNTSSPYKNAYLRIRKWKKIKEFK